MAGHDVCSVGDMRVHNESFSRLMSIYTITLLGHDFFPLRQQDFGLQHRIPRDTQKSKKLQKIPNPVHAFFIRNTA